MADGQSEDEEFLVWASTAQVRRIFAELRGEVQELQKCAYLGLPDVLSPAEIRVLDADLHRLSRYAGGVPQAEAAASILADMHATSETRAYPEWFGQEWILRGRHGTCDPEVAANQCRHHAIVQALTMDASAWSDPSRALLYTGLQHALHAAFRDSFERREPNITEMLVGKIELTFDGRILRPLQARAIEIPGPRKLDFGTASMQEEHDLLAADLALVIGMRIRGREMYRVVLLQAKNPEDDGKYDVSSKVRSQQIDKLLSTGMGWYLFYPDVKRHRPFIATVRPATEIFAEVFEDGKPNRYRRAFHVQGNEHSAWELGTFVAAAMTSQHLHLGRLFPDVETAADALSIERKLPLAKRVLVADLTGALHAHKLVGQLTDQGYRKGKVFPTSTDQRFDDDAPPSGFSPGRKG